MAHYILHFLLFKMAFLKDQTFHTKYTCIYNTRTENFVHKEASNHGLLTDTPLEGRGKKINSQLPYTLLFSKSSGTAADCLCEELMDVHFLPCKPPGPLCSYCIMFSPITQIQVGNAWDKWIIWVRISENGSNCN